MMQFHRQILNLTDNNNQIWTAWNPNHRWFDLEAQSPKLTIKSKTLKVKITQLNSEYFWRCEKGVIHLNVSKLNDNNIPEQEGGHDLSYFLRGVVFNLFCEEVFFKVAIPLGWILRLLLFVTHISIILGIIK